MSLFFLSKDIDFNFFSANLIAMIVMYLFTLNNNYKDY
jgi:hypothetical protein